MPTQIGADGCDERQEMAKVERQHAAAVVIGDFEHCCGHLAEVTDNTEPIDLLG